MLQKIVNGIAIASGVVSLTVVGTVGYVFIRKDAIIENVKGKIMESVLPSGLGAGSLIPDMKRVHRYGTNSTPSPSGVGLGIPSF
ncbi:MAG: hypothetical protein CM15mV9_0050 [uncultured marine virus]|nr:MAG: hypothetical protein CM15mV9_0050 [uncultured marine virus]